MRGKIQAFYDSGCYLAPLGYLMSGVASWLLFSMVQDRSYDMEGLTLLMVSAYLSVGSFIASNRVDPKMGKPLRLEHVSWPFCMSGLIFMNKSQGPAFALIAAKILGAMIILFSLFVLYHFPKKRIR